jgi:hypothetical protein
MPVTHPGDGGDESPARGRGGGGEALLTVMVVMAFLLLAGQLQDLSLTMLNRLELISCTKT